MQTIAKSFTINQQLKYVDITIDPYSRIVISGLAGFVLVLIGANTDNRQLVYIGSGLIGLGAIQSLELSKGAKIIKNDYHNPIYVLHETEGIKEIAPYQLPRFRIDGLTRKGLHGVFKAKNGIYLSIDKDGNISETFGLGRSFNRLMNAGFKTKDWVVQQKNNRWRELLQYSY